MPDYSPHQRKIIDRYYQHRDDIMVAKLSELVSELYVADGEKARDRLWRRAETAMRNLKWKDAVVGHVMQRRDPKVLAENLNAWLQERGPAA